MTMNPLKEKRVTSGLTIAQLASRSGVAPNTISKLERGEQSAQPLTLQKLATALGCTFADLADLEKQNA